MVVQQLSNNGPCRIPLLIGLGVGAQLRLSSVLGALWAAQRVTLPRWRSRYRASLPIIAKPIAQPDQRPTYCGAECPAYQRRGDASQMREVLPGTTCRRYQGIDHPALALELAARTFCFACVSHEKPDSVGFSQALRKLV